MSVLLFTQQNGKSKSCFHMSDRLAELHHEHADTSLIVVIDALKEWSQDAQLGTVIVFEVVDGSGKTFHVDAVEEALRVCF